MADRTFGVEGRLLVGGHEVGLVLQPDVAGQARAVDEDFSAKGALLGNVVVLALLQTKTKIRKSDCDFNLIEMI